MNSDSATDAPIASTDEYRGDIPARVPGPLLRDLSQLNPFRSVAAIVLELGSIAGAIWLCETFFHPLLYVLVVFWIGSRLHGLGVLLHEGAHYRLLKNRKWNDLVSEIFLAWPLTITMVGYRQSHWAHHHELNTSKDPDWVQDIHRPEFLFPKTKREIFTICAKDLVGYYGIQEMRNASGFRTKVPKHLTILRSVGYAAVALAAIVFGFVPQLLMYWLVPLSTTFLLLMYVRAVADHHAGLAHDHIYAEARTTILSWWEALLIAPHNINYHIEHHFYPSVPFYNLPRLHQVLLEDPVYQRRAHLTKGIVTGLLQECQTCAPLESERLQAS
jgi:fatty acid desaturase